MKTAIILIVSSLFTASILGCTAGVVETTEPTAVAGPTEPNGYCASSDDCASTDYCLVDWCVGQNTDGGCAEVNRCLPRETENSLCESDRWCADGLRCTNTATEGGVCVSAN